LEPAIIRKSDLIMCNSAELAQYAFPYKPHSLIHNVGQGVDLSAYHIDRSYDTPQDCKHLPAPIIGYIGALNSARLDIELLYHIAQKRPDYTFIFIGKEDNTFKHHPLRTLSNVHFLGLKPMNQIPAYTKILDVCLNPQAINEITIGNYPRKIDEYLAMGKPVVATRTHTMELFKDYVYLCSSSEEEYLAAIDKALTDNSQEIQNKRIAFAHTHSWKHSVLKIYKAIDDYESQKSIQIS